MGLAVVHDLTSSPPSDFPATTYTALAGSPTQGHGTPLRLASFYSGTVCNCNQYVFWDSSMDSSHCV